LIGDKFPKHIYHSIVCIGALVAHRENDYWAVDALGAPHVGERTEKELIQAFVDKIAELNPQLVTFNGNSFDLPVLRYRAMINGISAPGLAARPYFNRTPMTRSIFATPCHHSVHKQRFRYTNYAGLWV
jgi:predicted PolB exonuclease-like 3'-5' exonuclease